MLLIRFPVSYILDGKFMYYAFKKRCSMKIWKSCVCCEVCCHCCLRWSFSILPTCTHGARCWQDPRNAEIPCTQKGLAAPLLFQLAAVCQANLSFASVKGLGKTGKCWPVTRKWDSSFARERQKKSCLHKSLVVCTNITLKYSVLNVQPKSKEEHFCILQRFPYR